MPWNNQNGGGGWKSGGGGGGGGPWGQGPGNQPPDLEEMLRRSQDRVKQVMGGSGLPGPLVFLAGLVAIAVIAWYGFFFRVEKDEIGVVMRFGQYVRWEKPGLHPRLPPPIEEVYTPKVTERKKIEVGMRTFGSGNSSGVRDVPEESQMLTGDENIVDIDFVVFWRIEKPEDYLFNIKDPDRTVKDVAESAMREVIGRSKVSDVLAPGREPIELGAQALMQKILDSYHAGVRIMEVKIAQAQAPADVRRAFNDVVAAGQDRDRAQNEAQREANKIIPEARGEAERIVQAAEGYKTQTVAEATGQAARFNKVYEAYKNAPDVTRKRIFLETMEKVFSGTDKIILDPNAAQGSGVVPYLPLGELTKKQ